MMRKYDKINEVNHERVRHNRKRMHFTIMITTKNLASLVMQLQRTLYMSDLITIHL